MSKRLSDLIDLFANALSMDDDGRRKALALLVAGTFFMENLDATVITPAIPVMAKSFAVHPIDLNLGVSAYMLALGVFIPISGWASERFGARPVFMSSIIIFTLASLFCGLADSATQFVAIRVLQGIGGALMVPVGRLVVLLETPKEKLIHAIAILTWPALGAPILGPPLGGFIADHGDWRWIFWLNLPLGAIALFLAFHLVPRISQQKDKRFDWFGFLIIGSAFLCLTAGAELFSRPNALWLEAALILMGGIGLILLGSWHIRRTRHPVFEPEALKFPTFSASIWGGSLFRSGVSAVPFLVPLLFQIGFGFDAFSAGLVLMAVFAGNFAMKPATTTILRRFGFRTVLVVNGVINAAMIAACAMFSRDMSMWYICLILFVSGMTRSMQFTALNTIAFVDVPQKLMSSANTLFSTAFQIAMGLGVALGAIAWRIGEIIAPGTDLAFPFRVAFIIVAIVSLLGTVDCFLLQRDAGDHVSRVKA